MAGTTGDSGEEEAGFGQVLISGISPIFEIASYWGQLAVAKELGNQFPEQTQTVVQTPVDPALQLSSGSLFSAEFLTSPTVLKMAGVLLASVLGVVLLVKLVK